MPEAIEDFCLNSKPLLIIALDTQSKSEALNFFKKTKSKPVLYKVGLELFSAAGPDLVRELISQGARIFLDLKIYDIPNTMAGATKSIASLGVEMFTFHLSSGAEGIKSVLSESKNTLALGVSVLTSFTDKTWGETSATPHTVSESVTHMVDHGAQSGVQGIVCSAYELAESKKKHPKLKFVVPGIRFSDSSKDDQARVMTPQQAATLGAYAVVMGRPIFKSDDPLASIDRYYAEIGAEKVKP
jgi:orotidine-5'-phosphate decarboxylase